MSETCPLCGRYCGIVSACVASVAQDASIERLERIVALKLEMMELRTVNAKLLAACEAVEWVGLPFFVEHEWICAVCQRRKSEGHAPNCQLAAAIREGRAADADK